MSKRTADSPPTFAAFGPQTSPIRDVRVTPATVGPRSISASYDLTTGPTATIPYPTVQ